MIIHYFIQRIFGVFEALIHFLAHSRSPLAYSF